MAVTRAQPDGNNSWISPLARLTYSLAGGVVAWLDPRRRVPKSSPGTIPYPQLSNVLQRREVALSTTAEN